MTNQFYDVLMCFFSPSVKLLLQGARLPSVGPAHLSADLTGPLPGLQPASDDPFFSFSFCFVHLFVLVTTNKESRKQTNEYNMTHLLWARLLREDCAFMFNDKFACLFVFQKDRGFAHACDPALHHKSIVTNWKSGQQ